MNPPPAPNPVPSPTRAQNPNWGRVKAIFTEALEAPPSEREKTLSRLAQSPEEFEAARGLLIAHGSAEGFLTEPSRPGPVDAEWRGTSGPEPERIGPFTLHERLGEGGFAVVYRASQVEPVERQVALKLLKAGPDPERARARFAAERRHLSSVDHPDIVKILDAGAAPDGRLYVAMELIRGDPVTRFAERTGLSPRGRVALTARIARAVHHVHQRALIHRDLKPSNILIEPSEDGPRPRIIDFGIATAVERSHRPGWTAEGTPIGTPRYAAPEQSTHAHATDTRADVYAIGMILCELLTGSLPREPARPHAPTGPEGSYTPAVHPAAAPGLDPARRRFVRGDLSRIILKATAFEPAHRYDSAAALADDLDRFLRDEPVLAVPPSRLYRAGKFIARHRLATSATAAAAASLVAALLMAVRAQARAAEEARRAEDVTTFILRDMVAQTDPDMAFGSSRDPTVIALLRGIEAAVDGWRPTDPRARFDVLSKAAVSAAQLRRHDDARRMARRALDLAESLDRPPQGPILELGLLLNTLGQSPASGPAADERRAIARQAVNALGRSHRVSILAALASARDTPPGDPSIAQLNELAGLAAHDHTLLRPVLVELASGLRAMGRHEEEIEQRRRILDITQASLAPSRSETLSARHQLVIALASAGREREALDALAPILELGPESIPDDHPGRFSSELLQIRLHAALDEQGHALRLARALTERTLARNGESSHEHAVALTTLGRQQFAAGDMTAAAATLERALDLRRAALRPLDTEREGLLDLLDRARKAAAPPGTPTISPTPTPDR